MILTAMGFPIADPALKQMKLKNLGPFAWPRGKPQNKKALAAYLTLRFIARCRDMNRVVHTKRDVCFSLRKRVGGR